jgi:hypothetical protein
VFDWSQEIVTLLLLLLLFTVAVAVVEEVIVKSCSVISVPPSDPVNEDPGVTEETHELVAFAPLVHETFPSLVLTVFATVIEEGVPGVTVASAVARLLAEGATGDTVAVLEENAAVEPLAFVAVTRQRIGLWYPKVKKLDGGVYVDKLLVPGALM